MMNTIEKRTKSRVIMMLAAVPLLMLGACSANCHCPECSRANVINPPASSTTIIQPTQQ